MMFTNDEKLNGLLGLMLIARVYLCDALRVPLVHAAIGGQFDGARFVHVALDAADARTVRAKHLGSAAVKTRNQNRNKSKMKSKSKKSKPETQWETSDI